MVGYLTGRPGLCLTVSGPGMTNAISGLLNAQHNSWPMILISGSSDTEQGEMGAFQEVDQVAAAKPFVKLSMKITKFSNIPLIIEKAVRVSCSGRPGPVYIDVPADILNERTEQEIHYFPRFDSLPFSCPLQKDLEGTLELLKLILLKFRKAKRPLIIIGKGAAYSNVSSELTHFIGKTNIPFLPTPMGKGVVSDYHELCISAARSFTLKNADLIFLVGAKLNWILHYGKPPRFAQNFKLIQNDISPEEIGNNVKADVALFGDIKITFSALNKLLEGTASKEFVKEEWLKELKDKTEKNSQTLHHLMNTPDETLDFYTAYNEISKHLPEDYILVNEGSTSMVHSVLTLGHWKNNLEA